MVNSGDILITNRKGKSNSLYSRLQRFFTKRPFTHSEIVVGEIFGELASLSAEELTMIRPLAETFTQADVEVHLFSIKNIDEKTIISTLKKLFVENGGKQYGFLQILWFAWRWIGEMFGVDMKKKPNYFVKKGVICSELVYLYLEQLNLETRSATKGTLKDSVHVGDIYDILMTLPKYFEYRKLK